MNSKDYERTPSVYTNREVFEKYLGHTSYYVALQDSTERVVRLAAPGRVLDLGSGTGETSVRLAAHAGAVVAVDNRDSMVRAGAELAASSGAQNVEFLCADMTDYVRSADLDDVDCVTMLYSFHHILDPLDEKRRFLADLYCRLAPGALLCIGETFLPDAETEQATRLATAELWDRRPVEGYASTLWWALDGLDTDRVAHARAVGEFSRKHAALAGQNVLHRNEEYLVTREWLAAETTRTGFELVLSEPINAHGDGIVLVRR
jgi:SAM-dependent methyltransferase